MIVRRQQPHKMNRNSNRRVRVRRAIVSALCLLLLVPAVAGPLLPPVQVGNVLRMTNANVRLDYDLGTGRANFYWQNKLKITGFYSGVGLDKYITDTVYTNRSWSFTSNQVEVTSRRGDLPSLKQIFIFDQDNSFLTRCELTGTKLQSRWMGPLVMDTPGGVDIGRQRRQSRVNRALRQRFIHFQLQRDAHKQHE